MTDPNWLTELESKARAADDKTYLAKYGIACDVFFAEMSPTYVLALCKLVRRMGEALSEVSSNNKYGDITDVEGDREVYQRGPVADGEKG